MKDDSFKPGDVIRLYTKNPTDKKVRTTPFEGVVIAIHGRGQDKTFTLRKVSAGAVAIERIFPANSPAIEKIQVIKRGEVRRAKLYHLRKSK